MSTNPGCWTGPDLPTLVVGGPKPTHPEPSLRAALQSLTSAIVFHAGDWGIYPREAWIYGIAVGWECEDDHSHDYGCGGSDALNDMAAKHGWDENAVERLRELRRHYRAAERTQLANPCRCGHGWGLHRAGVSCVGCDCTRYQEQAPDVVTSST